MKLLSFAELKPLKGIPFHRTHVVRLVKAKKFPAPVPVGDHRIAWVESEIDDWIVQRIAKRDSQASAA